MILNSGLDAMCQDTGAQDNNPNHPYFAGSFRYAAFGTGSTEPDVTQTTLDAQVGDRSSSHGGFTYTDDAGRDDTNDVMWYEGTFTRVFDIAAPVNAAEWGLAAVSTGNLSARGLFRQDPEDDESTPITIDLDEGDELQLVITFRVECPWEFESASFIIEGAPGNDAAGTYEGAILTTSGSSEAVSSIRAAIATCWPGPSSFTPSHGTIYAIMGDQGATTKVSNLVSIGTGVSLLAEPYTPGNYYRDSRATWGTSSAVGDIYGFTLGHATTRTQFLFSDPAYLTKENTHRLYINMRFSIARL